MGIPHRGGGGELRARPCPAPRRRHRVYSARVARRRAGERAANGEPGKEGPRAVRSVLGGELAAAVLSSVLLNAGEMC